MFKKILLPTVILMIIGVLVFGAVNRTLAQNSQESSGRRNREITAVASITFPPLSLAARIVPDRVAARGMAGTVVAAELARMGAGQASNTACLRPLLAS